MEGSNTSEGSTLHEYTCGLGGDEIEVLEQDYENQNYLVTATQTEHGRA